MDRKTIVYYGPNESKFNETLEAIKNFEISARKEAYYCIFGHSTMTNSIAEVVKKNVKQLIFADGYSIPEKNNALCQACQWVLTSIHCYLKKKEWRDLYGYSDEELMEYYAGSSFGEFWAVTYADVLEGNLSIAEAIKMAYKRGEIMEKVAKTQNFVEMHLEKCSGQDLILLSNFEKMGAYVGIGSVHYSDGSISLFGTKDQLSDISKKLGVRLVPSIPFNSHYLFNAAIEFSYFVNCQEGNKQLSDVVLTDKITKFIPGILAQQFYISLNELGLKRKIGEMLYDDGHRNFEFIGL